MARRRRLPAFVATVLLAAVLLVGALGIGLPLLERARPVMTATPSLGPLGSRADVRLPGGSRLCVAPVPFDPSTQVAQIVVNAPGGPIPLAFDASGPRYVSRTTIVAPRSEAATPVNATLRPAPRSLVGKLCVHNRSHAVVSLLGTNEGRSLGIAKTSVDGRVLADQAIALTFLEARPHSLLSRSGEVLGRASELTGGLLPVWLLWPLLALAAVGAPVAIVAAFYASARDSAP
jgi:hypothetical protein